MTSDQILALIKWGPILLFLLIFLWGLIVGMIKGNRKVIRRFIYVAIYVTTIILVLPIVTREAMTITVNGMTVEAYINGVITNNEQIKGFFDGIPGLLDVVLEYPSAIISLLLFFVLLLVGLPLSFPVYWLFMAIYALISKLIFKYSRFEKDENGEYIRNAKGKKIKKKKKCRVVAGVIKGVQYVVVTSLLFTPVGVITRLYKTGKDATESKSLANISYFESFEDYLRYIDAYNNSFIGFVTDNPLNEGISDYLTQLEIEGEKTNVEEEISTLVKTAVYVEESGIIKLLSTGADINTLDLSALNVDKLEAAINMLFESKSLNSLVGDGINYVLENFLEENLIKITNDTDIVSKLKYEDSSEIKQELLTVTSLLKTVINAKLLEHYQNSGGDFVKFANALDTADVETILNKVLSIKILSKAMPSLVTNLLDDYGLSSTLTVEDNNEFAKLVVNAVTLFKTLELQSMDDIMAGNMVDNIIDALYSNGAIKDSSVSALAELLANISSSNVFDDVLVTQLNNVLVSFDINLNSQMIINVNTKEGWMSELAVLEDLCKLYKDFTTENKVDFLTVNNLMEDLKDTKAMILAFPIAYKTMFPMLGIEIDASKIVYVDYTDPNAATEEAKFYNYWKSQLESLSLISTEFAKLEVDSMEDVSLDLFKDEDNRPVVADILAIAFDMDLLKNGVIGYLDTMISQMLVEYGVELNEGAIASVNNLVETYPKYVVVDDVEYDVDVNNEYYIDGVKYTISTEELFDNTLNRVWLHEVNHLSTLITTITSSGDFTNPDTLTALLDAVDEMYLLREVKVDLLLYAVGSTNLIDVSSIDESQIDFAKEKDILINVVSKMDVINNLGGINFATMSPAEQENIAFVLDNVIASDIFASIAIDAIVSAITGAGIGHDDDTASTDNAALISTIKSISSWNDELTAIKALSNVSDSSDVTEALFTTIESSTILGACKNKIMIMMVETVNAGLDEQDVKLTVPTVEELKATVPGTSKTQYELTKELVLEAASLSNMDLATMSDEDIANLAMTIEKMKVSVVFSPKYDEFATGLADTLDDADVIYDGAETDGLVTTIKGVTNWNKELLAIKKLTTLNGSNDVNSTLFTTIEDSIILGACKYNIMIKLVNTVNEGLAPTDVKLTVPSVSTLKAVVAGGTKTQYELTKELILDSSVLTNLDLATATSTDIAKASSVIDNMKLSAVFSPKYDEFVTTLVNSLQNADYGITAQNRNIVSWNDELTALANVTKGIDAVNNLDANNPDASVVGALLDAIDTSILIDDSSSQNVANKIAQNMSDGAVTSVTKNGTWASTFETLINQLKSPKQ